MSCHLNKVVQESHWYNHGDENRRGVADNDDC